MNSMQYICKPRIGAKGRAPCAFRHDNQEYPLRLPGGEYWWLNSYRSTNSIQIIYGDQFVIERPKIGGEGLTLANKVTDVVVHRTKEGTALSTVQYRTQEALSVFVPGISQSADDTALALVPREQERLSPHREDSQMPRHPRRTARVSFTCNICAHRNKERPVNPHAWRKGSVFARCEECLVVHKLVDNLEIFHEMQGDVFPPRHLRNSILIQEILENIKEKNQ